MSETSGRAERLERFVDALCGLELDPELLRADPRGEAWLPDALRRMVGEDPACARELEEFVAVELSLLGMHEPCDAVFTRRVLDRLPALEAVDDRRRTWILASAYALAIGVGYLLLGPLLRSGELARAIAALHGLPAGWQHAHAVEAGGIWIALALLLLAAALVLMPTDRLGDRVGAWWLGRSRSPVSMR